MQGRSGACARPGAAQHSKILPKALDLCPLQVADRSQADMQQAVKVPWWLFTNQPRETVLDVGWTMLEVHEQLSCL